MRVAAIIQKNETAWQEVSPYWKDTISQRFQDSVMSELNRILQSLDSACVVLEDETDKVKDKLRKYENL
jgi:hypothetical protein